MMFFVCTTVAPERQARRVRGAKGRPALHGKGPAIVQPHERSLHFERLYMLIPGLIVWLMTTFAHQISATDDI